MKPDFTLPPLDSSRPPLVCTVTKKYKYVSFVFRERHGGAIDKVFTIHEVDARRILEALAAAIDSPPTENFELVAYGRTAEGISAGGPPEREQLAEFKAG